MTTGNTRNIVTFEQWQEDIEKRLSGLEKCNEWVVSTYEKNRPCDRSGHNHPGRCEVTDHKAAPDEAAAGRWVLCLSRIRPGHIIHTHDDDGVTEACLDTYNVTVVVPAPPDQDLEPVCGRCGTRVAIHDLECNT